MRYVSVLLSFYPFFGVTSLSNHKLLAVNSALPFGWFGLACTCLCLLHETICHLQNKVKRFSSCTIRGDEEVLNTRLVVNEM